MKSVISLLTVAAFVAADELKGTCTDGLDVIGVEQACYGRCHIYESGPGWYGACNYKVEDIDVTGPCGDSVQNACLSTFNAGWDAKKENCGNCYYVQMRYDDGTVKSTYLKTMDTNGSETKFEMNAPAWVNLCPYVCAGSGICAPTVEFCEGDGGVLAQSATYPGPISCTNQRSPVTFMRVDCEGSAPPPVAPTNAPVVPTQAPVNPTQPPVVVPTYPPVVVPTNPPVVTEAPVEPPVTGGDVIAECKRAIGHSSNAAWDQGCKDYCDFYGASAPHCPANTVLAGLVACVKQGAPYCEDL